MPVRFTAPIAVIGINPHVVPPQRALRAIFGEADKDSGPIPIRGTLQGKPFLQTLVKYAGAWRLYLNGPMLEGTGLKVGGRARVTIAHDPRPRTEPMPPALAVALEKDVRAREAFNALPPSRRKEILRYLNQGKTETTLLRNVARVVGHLSGRIEEKPLVVLRAITPKRPAPRKRR